MAIIVIDSAYRKQSGLITIQTVSFQLSTDIFEDAFLQNRDLSLIDTAWQLRSINYYHRSSNRLWNYFTSPQRNTATMQISSARNCSIFSPKKKSPLRSKILQNHLFAKSRWPIFQSPAFHPTGPILSREQLHNEKPLVELRKAAAWM